MSGHHGQVKGIWFPSYGKQAPSSDVSVHYKPGLVGRRQRMRLGMRRLKPYLDSKDPIVVTAGQRVIMGVYGEPDAEYAAVHIMCAALDVANMTGATWVEAVNNICDEWDRRDQENAPPEQAEADPAPKRKQGRGLLRGLVESTFLSRFTGRAKEPGPQGAGGRDIESAEPGTDTTGDDREGAADVGRYRPRRSRPGW